MADTNIEKSSAMETNSLHLVQLHYHLKSGGVRIVMENIIRAIRQAAPKLNIRATTLTGTGSYLELPDRVTEPHFEHHLVRIPGLDYTQPQQPRQRESRIFKLTKQLLASVKPGPGATLVIGHNITLGKNPMLPAAFKKWAIRWENVRFVSLIHDFPEDNRPECLWSLNQTYTPKEISNSLYPNLPNFRFCVINGRDLRAMLEAGMPRQKVGWVRNSVLGERFSPLSGNALALARQKAAELLPRSTTGKKILLYPVRIMRRKNLLEAVFLTTLLGKDKWQLWIALPPTSPAEIQFWREIQPRLAKSGVEVLSGFAGGNAEMACSLNELYNASDLIVSTSVQEGFGFSFYEGWLSGRAVVGRSIPGIVQGGSSMKLDHFYTRLLVPADWIDMRHLREQYACRLQQVTGKKSKNAPASFLGKAMDFGYLDVENQMSILMNHSSPKDLRTILTLNPGLQGKLHLWKRFPADRIRRNAAAVGIRFSPRRIGRAWLNLARSPMGAGRIPADLHSRLVAQYIRNPGLHLLNAPPQKEKAR